MQVACLWLWCRGRCAGRLEAVWWCGHTCGAPQATVRKSNAPVVCGTSLQQTSCLPLGKQSWGLRCIERHMHNWLHCYRV